MTNRTSTMPLLHHIDAARSTNTTSEHWWDAAACKFFGPAPFFAPDDETHGQRARREHTAKLICRPCPVRHECLHYALAIGEHHGVWGGATEHERKVFTYAPRRGREGIE
ncbi:WhiB family transcriptional regulator [Rhodococcus rhodochrous]|nr:WhiB family transcriptional regulator [Rhodococcus rhodochrous]